MQREQERLRESGTFSTEYNLSPVLKNHDVFCFFGFWEGLDILCDSDQLLPDKTYSSRLVYYY
jgi:hypothetical protein